MRLIVLIISTARFFQNYHGIRTVPTIKISNSKRKSFETFEKVAKNIRRLSANSNFRTRFSNYLNLETQYLNLWLNIFTDRGIRLLISIKGHKRSQFQPKAISLKDNHHDFWKKTRWFEIFKLGKMRLLIRKLYLVSQITLKWSYPRSSAW